MNKQSAQADGFQFHGAYSRNKEEIKVRALELRAKGYKARTITMDSGYSLYVESKYFTDRTIAEIRAQIDEIPLRIERVKQDAEISIRRLNEEKIELTDKLSKLDNSK